MKYNIKTIKSHEDFLEFKKYAEEHEISLRVAAFILKEPTKHCLYCSKIIKRIVNETSSKIYYPNYCGRSCQNKDMHKNMSEATKRLASKRRVKTLAQPSSVPGYTKSQLASLKAAKNTDLKKRAAKISRSKKEKSDMIKMKHEKRIQNIVTKIGWIRLGHLLLNIYGKNRRFDHAMNSLKKIHKDLVCDIYLTNFQEYYIIINNMKPYRICEICGKKYTNHKILMSKYQHSASRFTCSSSCRNIRNAKFRDKKTYQKNLSDEQRSEISRKLRERHKNMSLEEKKIQARKRYETMKRDIVDGKTMLQRRSEKALMSKIERGIIGGYTLKEKTQYSKYRAEVYRHTNENDLTILENYHKRGKHNYHLDHIFPIAKGFLYGIPPHMIGDTKNLQMLPAKENKEKTDKIITIPKHIQEFINANNIKIIL